jgi:hypothetical protein
MLTSEIADDLSRDVIAKPAPKQRFDAEKTW